MPLTQPYQQVKDSVVRVVALNGNNPVSFGSGSVIESGRIVLTCAHCIVSGAQMAIVDPKNQGQVLFGGLVYSDPTNDIALLEFPYTIGTPAKFANSASCAVGNGAFVVGFPLGVSEQTLLSAHIASIAGSHLRIDASVNHGNSGGPLFNLRGEQIGVINAKHGSLSQFLTQLKNVAPGAVMSIGGFDAVKAIRVLIEEMQKNLNLGIGYAIPTALIKPLHPILTKCVP
jgi:S1-C subfamily serine protease